MRYAHLHTLTNFTFLTGASHPEEYVYRAYELGYDAIAITDECSLAGVVKAFVAAESLDMKLIIGSTFTLSNGMPLLIIAPSRTGYAELSGFITLARRRAAKGAYEAHFEDLRFRLRECLVIYLADVKHTVDEEVIEELQRAFRGRLWIGMNHQLLGGEQRDFQRWLELGIAMGIPLVACGRALMHAKERKPLQDLVTAIRHNTPLESMGTRLELNGESYLKSLSQLERLYPESLLDESCEIADRCHFSMNELRYQYPQELVPEGLTPIQHLRQLVDAGKHIRWPEGVPTDTESLINKELELIEELAYEFYFLTVHDIVRYAREKNILCQGRGSAANSVVCYCLFITEIRPGQINVLFERFISQERDEPPDIDVDFEHERREEVIQYIYEKYGRERAAIAATVITYRSKSAIRDVGKAMGLEPSLIDRLTQSMAWWDSANTIPERLEAAGLKTDNRRIFWFLTLVEQLIGFPRHLSQHTGGFVISQSRISDLVPLENASMPDRTVIQWDKTDLESMRLLKVDVLALGALTALRKSLEYIHQYDSTIQSIADIPREDSDTYDMLCAADTVGIFQIESRAQMSMLPRLQPRCFYDLVVQIAIVRPGPIQGDMVHPYLRRRNGLEPITYASEAIKDVLQPTLGVPIFQEQVMRLSMVAAGFTGGEADELRRAITNWGKNSKLLLFEDKLVNGFLSNGYSRDFAERMFEQIKGFGGYGFPESHSASFALICYAAAWVKRHHPAAFYCAILNSQPMGFYSPSQLVQDARRHGITVLPVDINKSVFDNVLECDDRGRWGIRLGFRQVNYLREDRARSIERCRGAQPFHSLAELAKRTSLTASDLECLASADVLRSLAGNRHQAQWSAAATMPSHDLLSEADNSWNDELLLPAPTLEKDVLDDYASVGLTLRAHPMALLRSDPPFHRCRKQSELAGLRQGQFVQVAGLVTCLQRPGTAKGTLFATLEDETGSINVIIWARTQETFRQVILTSKLMLVKGTVELNWDNPSSPVIHVVAGYIQDLSERLPALLLKKREFH